MAPYRTTSREHPADAPRDAGIVGDVIDQFADPLAFYRELVQNSIDAGTPSIEVELTHDGRATRVAVTDRGEGMSRDTLENQLLVLFRSTKERDPNKIGKFGIGFASVLAPDPEVVVVTSARDGHRLVLHLNRDLTYQLYDAGPATQTGTTVELRLPMPIAEARTLAHESVVALTRWCRHATVPIQFEAKVEGLVPPLSTRIDRPLALEGALVEVRGTTPDGLLTVVIGFTADPEPSVGFFNHGLTLWETRTAVLGRLQLKIQDGRLGHTLSRDNVRRDAHYRRAIEFARALASRELIQAATQRLRAAADAGDHETHLVLARAIERAGLEPRADQWSWPLSAPIGERRSINASTLRAYGARAWGASRTKLATALASAGIPVLHVDRDHADWVGELLRKVAGTTLAHPDAELVHVAPVARTPADHALVETLGELLDACHRSPTAIEIATLEGAHDQRLAITGAREEALHAGEGESWVLERELTRKNPFAFLRTRPLILSARHDLVRRARGADDPVLAASHLTRAVLMHYGLLDADRSAKLLDLSLARVGTGGRA